MECGAENLRGSGASDKVGCGYPIAGGVAALRSIGDQLCVAAAGWREV
nr:hypothetical protein [Nocardia jiangxiensis]